MKIDILKGYRNLPAGKTVSLTPNAVNTWVGANGTGKSSLLGLLLRELPTKECHWAALNREEGAIKVQGFEGVTQVTISSPRLRQVQLADMSALIQMGLKRLHSSDGQNNVADLNAAAALMDDPTVLHVFDEIDGHLDYFGKVVFFAFLSKIKGTTILISHDPSFLFHYDVLDFGDFKTKKGSEYYEQQYERYKAMSGLASEKSEPRKKGAAGKKSK